MFRALCAHHQEVKIALHSLWYHHTYRWPSRARDTKLSAVILHFVASALSTAQTMFIFLGVHGGGFVNLISCGNKSTGPFPLSYYRAGTLGADMLLNLPCSSTDNFHRCTDRTWGIPILPYIWCRVCPGVKWPGSGVKHPPPPPI
jgi:hypothetical protein